MSRRPKRPQRQSSKQGRPERGGRKPRRGAPSSGRGRGKGRRDDRPQQRAIGRVQKNPQGFAFLIPVDPKIPDAYVGREEASWLLNDDRVEFTLQRNRGRLSARIERIVSRARTEVLGRVRSRKGGGGILETAEGEVFSIRGRTSAEDGDWAMAKIDRYPSPREGGVVTIEQNLGRELTPKHDFAIALARFGIEEGFSPEALQDAQDGRKRAQELIRHFRDEAEGRRDMRHLPFVTIDGEDAKDFDDAVLVECPPGGPAFLLYVAIADVSYFVREGTALDAEARRRGTSIYFPGRAIPMLPESLSNDLCSLRPQEEKLALVAEIHYDREGNPTRTRYYEALIRTARRLTYTNVHRYAEGDPQTRRELAELAGPLERMEALHKKFLKHRTMRGVLDFNLPEGKLELDADGRPTAAFPAPRWESHKWIEEMMIAANRAVAKSLKDRGSRHAVYRVHEPPDPTGVEELNQLLKALGVSKRIESISPLEFAAILEATSRLKGAATLHQAILRRQKQARYETEPRGHFGLALSDYTHFTSPIRRYPDLVVHRALKRLIHEKRGSDKESGGPPLEQVAAQNSESERRAMEAERWTVRRKQCWFLKERIGETYPGRISGVTAKGLFVEIPEFAIDGFLPLVALPGTYDLDERRQCLRKRPGHTTLAVGDEMTVKVKEVSVEDNTVELEPMPQS